MEDTFWTHDTYLFDGSFTYYGKRVQPVRGRLHVSGEKFSEVVNSLERDYLKTTRGTRLYVMMQPYVIEPKLIMSVALDPKPKHYADAPEAIGTTTGTRVEGYRDTQIGNAQAWYYPDDRVLVRDPAKSFMRSEGKYSEVL